MTDNCRRCQTVLRGEFEHEDRILCHYCACYYHLQHIPTDVRDYVVP
jgi:hypothetical protein